MSQKLPPEQNMSFFSFNMYPRMRYEEQWNGEYIILVLRAAPVTQIPWIFNSILFVLLLIALNFVFPFFLDVAMILFANMYIVAAIGAYIWVNILVWYFNVGVITNKRVIDIDFHNILHKEVSQAEIGEVTDVTAKTFGFLPSFFNYGNIFVQTKGTNQNIEFLRVPKPNKVVEILNRLLRDSAK